MVLATGRRAGTARERIVDVALELFAEHGVSGTSLQMIADALGVTKAAVYHQFQTKEDILLAVLAPALDELGAVADAADAQRTPAARRETVFAGLVDLVVGNRRLAAVLHGDPAVTHLLRADPTLRTLAERVNRMLTGPAPDAEARVCAAMAGGGVMVAGVDPLLADLDDETLRQLLLDTGRRVLRLRPPAAKGSTGPTGLTPPRP